MAWLTAMVGVAAALGGIILGSALSRRNERRTQGERLLVEAVDGAISAIAEVANGDPGAQARYAAAVSRITLHGSPNTLSRFREFQEDATTVTSDGKSRLVRAVQAARQDLGRDPVPDGDIARVLFGRPDLMGWDRDVV